MDGYVLFFGILMAFAFVWGLVNPKKYGLHHNEDWSTSVLRGARVYRLLRGWR